VCSTVCREQHTAKARFAVCPAKAHGELEAHGILGLCRESRTANTRYMANLNLCREQHTAKLGTRQKLTPAPSRQLLLCAAVRHTAKTGFAVNFRMSCLLWQMCEYCDICVLCVINVSCAMIHMAAKAKKTKKT